MKKLFVFLVLSVLAVNARAAIFINNTAPYDVMLTLWAHDGVITAPCSYYSLRFPVVSNGSAAFNNVNSAGLEWSQPWMIPATLVGPGTFDAIDVVPMYSGVPYGTIGGPGSCAASTSFSGTGSSYTIHATWTDLGGGNILVQISL